MDNTYDPPVNHVTTRKNRSLIRRMSTWLPAPNAKRIQFQEALLGSVMETQRGDEPDECSDSDCDFTDESVRQMWFKPTPVTLADLVWLAHDDGEPGIKLRTQLHGLAPPTASTPLPHRAQRVTAQCGAHGHGPSDSFQCQTPIRALSDSAHSAQDMDVTPLLTYQTPDNAALIKIHQLEQELNQLRQQLATIAMHQDTNNSSLVSVDSSLMSQLSSQTLSVPPTPPCAPPPCAPPPPPPPAFGGPSNSVMDLIKQRKNESGRKAGKSEKRINLSDVLKDLGTVKLKAIKRSPGGTPIRQKPVADTQNDPAAMIAHALKKKFARCQAQSPEGDNSPSSRFSPSYSTSPCKRTATPPGPHLLKSSVRRQFKRRSVSHSGLPEISPNCCTTIHQKQNP